MRQLQPRGPGTASRASAGSAARRRPPHFGVTIASVDRLFSLFGLYEFLGYVFAGALVLVGSYVAFEGFPEEPGAVTALSLVGVSYAVGHLVLAITNVWEDRWLWRKGRLGELRLSDTNDEAYSAEMKAAIDRRLMAIGVGDDIQPKEKFGIARADLRARGADSRSELMNTMYGLNRGLATACWLLVPVSVAAGYLRDHETRGWIVAFAFALAGYMYARRCKRFASHFADNVWQDFAQASETQVPPASR